MALYPKNLRADGLPDPSEGTEDGVESIRFGSKLFYGVLAGIPLWRGGLEFTLQIRKA